MRTQKKKTLVRKVVGDDTAHLKTASGLPLMVLDGDTPLERLVRRIRKLEFKSFGIVQE